MKKCVVIIDPFDPNEKDRKVLLIEGEGVDDILIKSGAWGLTDEMVEELKADGDINDKVSLTEYYETKNGDGWDYVEVYEQKENDLVKIF